MCDVFAGALAANIACYELPHKLASNVQKLSRTIGCGFDWVLCTARARLKTSTG